MPFSPSVPRGTFPGCSVSCSRKSAQIGNIESHMRNQEGQQEELSALFNLNSFHFMQIIDIRDRLKCFVIIKGLKANYQQGWTGKLWKAVSSDVTFSNSGKYLLLGLQMVYGSSQCSALFQMCHMNPKVCSLALLAQDLEILDRGFSSEIEESSS